MLSVIRDQAQCKELEYIAALTVIKNEQRAISSFSNCNKRTFLKGRERELIRGLDPYKLLSLEDKRMLVQINEMLWEGNMIQLNEQKCLENHAKLEPRIISVAEAEAKAASRGMIKYFSFGLFAGQDQCDLQPKVLDKEVNTSNKSTSTMPIVQSEISVVQKSPKNLYS